MKPLALAVGLVLVAAGAAPAAADRPNVLFIAVDDLNHWVGYLGRNPQTNTPNIDRLAARGVRVHAQLLRRAGLQPLARRADVRPAARPPPASTTTTTTGARSSREDLTLTTTFRKAGYYVCGAGKIYHEALPPPRASGTTTSRPRAATRSRPATPASAASSSPRSTASDEDLRDWKIVDYGIEQLQQEARQAVLPRRRPAQAAHALERAAEVLRHVPARPDRAAAVPRGRPGRRPAGRRADGQARGRPRGDARIRPLEGGGAGLPRRHRLLRRDDRPAARRLRQDRLPRQHDHRLLGRPRLAPRREAALAEVRPVGGGDPRAADLGRARASPSRTPSASGRSTS